MPWNVEVDSNQEVKKGIDDEKLPRKLVYKLYLNRALSSWGDRMWQFAISLYFVKLSEGSLELAAWQGLSASLAVFLTGPLIGRWINRTPRLKEARVALLLQNGFVALCPIFVALYTIEDPSIHNIFVYASPICLVIFSVISQIWSVAYTTALEKDWLLGIANNEAQLTELNAILRRIDLICSIVSPVVTGLLIKSSLLTSTIVIASWNVVSGFCEFMLLKSIYSSVPKLAEPKKLNVEESFKLFDLDAIRLYGRSFLLPGIGFSLLYLTVFGFDSITIGYISSRGIDEFYSGLVALVGGIFGVIGTLCYPIFVAKIGIKNSGIVGFVSELICLVLCMFVLKKTPVLPTLIAEMGDVILFLCGVVLARYGLWIADLSVNQLIQTATPNPPLVGSVQVCANVFMDVIKFGLVVVFPNPEQFSILVITSYVAAFTGTFMFILYVFNSKRN